MSRELTHAEYPLQVRQEADSLLQEFPERSPLEHAAELERVPGAYDGGIRLAKDVAEEMRRRAAAGVRFWPGPHAVDD